MPKDNTNLRKYQLEAKSEALYQLNSPTTDHNFLLNMATGSGKTITFNSIIEEFVNEKKKVLVIVDSIDLVKKNYNEYQKHFDGDVGLEHGNYHAFDNIDDYDVIFTSRATLASKVGKRLDKFNGNEFGLIVVDEAHHLMQPQYQTILKKFKGVPVLGATATPSGYETDRPDVASEIFHNNEYTYTLEQAIDDGNLVDIHVKNYEIPELIEKCPKILENNKSKNEEPDYTIKSAEKLLKNTDIQNEICENIIDYCKNGKKAVIFFPTRETAKQYVSKLKDVSQNLNIYYTDGENSKELHAFETSKGNSIICNPLKLAEGYDCPSIDTVINLRATKSDVLFRQIVGRGTRKSFGKSHMTILNFFYGCENVIQPGEIFRNNREWNFDVMRIAGNLQKFYEGPNHKEISLYLCKKEARKIKDVSKKLGYTGNIAGLSPEEAYAKLFSLEKSNLDIFKKESPFYKELQKNIQFQIRNTSLYSRKNEIEFAIKFKKLQEDYKEKGITVKTPNDVGLSYFGKLNYLIENEKEKLCEKYMLSYDDLKETEKNDVIIAYRNRELEKELTNPNLFAKSGLIKYIAGTSNLEENIKNIKLYSYNEFNEQATVTETETLSKLGIQFTGPVYKAVYNQIINQINETLSSQNITLDYCFGIAEKYNLNSNLDIYNVSVTQKKLELDDAKLNDFIARKNEFDKVIAKFERVENNSDDIKKIITFSCDRTKWKLVNNVLVYNNANKGFRISTDTLESAKDSLNKINNFFEKNIDKYTKDISESHKQIDKIINKKMPYKTVAQYNGMKF